MKNIINILRERTSGLFLLFLAILIISGLTLNSRSAQSNSSKEAAAASQPKIEEQVLGETIDSTEEVIVPEDVNPTNEMENTDSNEAQEQELNTDDSKITVNPDDSVYEELRAHLKKYCGKNFNVKKCQDYLKEAKELRSKGSRFKELYKKYHFESKEENKKEEPKPSDSTEQENKSELIVTTNGSSKSYKIAVSDAASVLGFMDLLQSDSSQNFSYHSSSGFVDKINGTENSGNFTWMLYTCKNGTCKLSSVGASDCKIKDWDKIEWKYLDWTTIDWSTW